MLGKPNVIKNLKTANYWRFLDVSEIVINAILNVFVDVAVFKYTIFAFMNGGYDFSFIFNNFTIINLIANIFGNFSHNFFKFGLVNFNQLSSFTQRF